MNYYFQAWRKAFDFKGRATRMEYWLFMIINGGIINLLVYGWEERFAWIAFLLAILNIIPAWAVSFRRMHDVDKPGMFFIIPIYGSILPFFDGTRGQNRFGPDPKLRGSEADPESMVMRSPVSRPLEPWQCSNCNTRNAAEVIECATCSRRRN